MYRLTDIYHKRGENQKYSMIFKIILIFHGFLSLIYVNLILFVKSIITLSCGAAK